jgi:glutathione S-transferase
VIATLYGMRHSHTVLTVRLMLEHKGLRHNVRDVLPGLHPVVVRAAGFPGRTVPAMRLGDELVQGSLNIARALDELVPSPALFPADPAARAAVESAERWAHDELQPLASRIFRWAGLVDNGVRAWMASEVLGWPAPRLLGHGFTPVMSYYARIIGADAAQVRQDLARLPEILAHADALVDAGVLGTGERNAADCHVLADLRLLAAHEDLAPLVGASRCGQAALKAVPHFPPGSTASAPVPAALPPEWVPAVR